MSYAIPAISYSVMSRPATSYPAMSYPAMSRPVKIFLIGIFGIIGLALIIIRWYQLCSRTNISGDECTTLIFKDFTYLMGFLMIIVSIILLIMIFPF